MWAFLVVFGVFGVLFVLAETYISPEPVMPLRLMKQRNPFCAFTPPLILQIKLESLTFAFPVSHRPHSLKKVIAVANFTSSSIAFSILYHYPLFFEAVKLQSSSEAGLHLIPYSIALSLASLGAGLVSISCRSPLLPDARLLTVLDADHEADREVLASYGHLIGFAARFHGVTGEYVSKYPRILGLVQYR